MAGNLAAFLGFDQLVQTTFPAAVRHHAAGVLVDDLHLAIAHQVIPIELIGVQRHQRLRDQLLPATPAGPHPAQRPGNVVNPLDPALGQLDQVLASVDEEVQFAFELHRDRQRLGVNTGLVGGGTRARNDQRSTRLVDEHAVGFIDDREVQSAQQQLIDPRL